MNASAAAISDWKVHEHGPLEQLASNLWRVEGALPEMPLRRHMLVVRLLSGELLIHNAVATRDDVREAIEALGEPAILVVPNAWHRLDAGRFKARYPSVKVYCPRGTEQKVGTVVPVDGNYEDLAALLGDSAGVTVEHLAGMKPGSQEGVFTIASDDGVSLVFNDAVFNQPHVPGLFGLIYRLVGSSGGPKVTRVAKLAMLKDTKAFKAQLLRLADTPKLVRVIPGHIDVIRDDAAGVLRSVANAL